MELTQDQEKVLRGYRRRMWMLILLSSGIDAAIFTAEAFTLMLPTLFSSLVVDEIIEWGVSSLIAKNKLDLKKRYKIVGLLPIPGLTSVSVQALLGIIKSRRKPAEVLALMAEA